MNKLFFIALYVCMCSSSAISQTVDTIYFDRAWKPCIKEKAKFFRLLQQVDSVYQIRDYYKTGILQMQASAITLEPEVLHGQCLYYHPNGKIESTGFYDKGKRIGLWKAYTTEGDLINKYDYTLEGDPRVNDSIQRVKNKIPVSHLDKNFSFAVRGKAISFFAFEDIYFRTATAGVEFLIKGRHSLGIDYTYFRWRFEHDDTDDKALTETYERRQYIYLDYKYRVLSVRDFDFYFNLYDKIGTFHTWQEGVSEGYNFWETPYLNDKTDGTFNQVGAGLGFKAYVGDRFYFDLSANGGKLFSNNNTVTYDSLFVADRHYNVKEVKGVFYIRLNLGYKLFVKKKEEQFYTN